jgi:hypothetical protein
MSITTAATTTVCSARAASGSCNGPLVLTA